VLSKALTHLRNPHGIDLREKAGNKKGSLVSLARLRAPISLIRMCINDQFQHRGKSYMSEGLDETCKIPAYVYGRLMAVYENLQWAANDAEQKQRLGKTKIKFSKREINLTVSDRYYGLASTVPRAAFPLLERLSRAHMRNLRRNNRRAANAIGAKIEELYEFLKNLHGGPFLSHLGLEGQGLFALGYYHQKARFRSQAQDLKQGSDSDNESLNESTDREKN
jgi:CRISPR-associated protein Csd1